MRTATAVLFAATTLLATAREARPREVVIGLHVDHPLLTAALSRELGLGSRPTALWGSLEGCQALVLRDVGVAGPDAEDGDGRLRVGATGTGRAGFDIGGYCLFPLSWSGTLQVDGRPDIGPDWQLRLVDRDGRLLDESGESTWVARRLWSFLGPEVDASIARFRFDLSPPADEIRALLALAVRPDKVAVVDAALDTLRPLDATAGRDAVVVRIAMDVQDVPAAAQSPPEPALTPEERAAWERRLDDWDAFLVFVVKDLGALDERQAVREPLFDLLMRSRHQLLEILSAGPQPGDDPARRLFLDAWTELRAIVRRAAEAGELHTQAQRYLAFLAAGDALTALDAAAPGLGLEISADGLRRLARILAPDAAADPLVSGEGTDPELQRLFGFHEPASSPPGSAEPPPEGPAEAEPDAEPDDSPGTAPDAGAGAAPDAGAGAAPDARPEAPAGAADGASDAEPDEPPAGHEEAPHAAPGGAPAARPEGAPDGASGSEHRGATPPASAAPVPPTTAPATPPPASPPSPASGSPTSWWPLSTAAWAAEPPVSGDVSALGRLLDRWVPPPEELRRYRDLVSQLLDVVAAAERARSAVPADFGVLYRHLVRATAWQESCWRQFTLRRGRVAPFRSPTGDVGIMQVNVRVWRGFFDVRKLEWDIVYNAGAGSEILARLLERFGEREAAERNGHPARACYAAYNGGPGSFARYRGKASPRDRAVDAMFWEKFQVTQAGQELDQVLCQPL